MSTPLFQKPSTDTNTKSLRRIMAIDDSDMLQAMYRLVMKRYEGCEVVVASNGAEALEKFTGSFDLILLDINMPVMGGLDFLRALRDRGIKLDVPVIVVSTEGQDEDIRQAMELGASFYLVKPFKSSSLHDTIAKAVSGLAAPK